VTPEGIKVTFVDYVADLSVEIAQADVVCCHAGASRARQPVLPR
jgi:UDP-N-acetylglucosamine:LPS N-acetylglucosamine transferase